MGSKRKQKDSVGLLNKNWINKFTIAGGAFLVWLIFIDSYNFISQIKLKSMISDLKQERAILEDKLEISQAELKKFNEDIEAYYREKYLYHKDNEKIILIETEDKK